ncbi:hypothetical protein CONPUDRAFT_158515 [Coniophora puteana RWD-64-598 SS2]|uniref:Transmembrane protein n=1 Tax=Coniophora puteana (strain RWD-64-598) TaxID=741705 RepID=A0A5M3MBV8_CONPW|nr:uncharacterized protein CONPUDRAFT_158515 [Coniophora puteana RWD-64-598 SS2]EIW76496.1 hypothetical protein CONPUDRAFT_158515 [Coniophora puteana RWD-64-598 SS2]
MPTITTFVDDQSPLITYSGAWSSGPSTEPALADYYYLGTYSFSSDPSQYATFSFNGTGLGVYGGKRNNHGLYSVVVDGETYIGNGNTSTYEWQTALYSNQSGMAQGMHTATMGSAVKGSLFGLDFVTWETEVGNDDQKLVSVMVQDTDPSFDYQDTGAWSGAPENGYMFNRGTGHTTSTENASATLTFTFDPRLMIYVGDVINLYGSVGTNNGQYSVVMDGEAPVTYIATRPWNLYQVMIYHASNLGPGEHRLTVTNLPNGGSQNLAIDYAEVMVLIDDSDTTCFSGTSGIETQMHTSSTRPSAGTIAGLVVLGATTVLALSALFWLWRRWKLSEDRYTNLYRNFAQREPRGMRFASAATTSLDTGDPTFRNRSSVSDAARRDSPDDNDPFGYDTGADSSTPFYHSDATGEAHDIELQRRHSTSTAHYTGLPEYTSDIYERANQT